MGDLRIIEGFESKVMGNRRSIRVWLPPGYTEQADKRYPVLYMMDGQNLFDATTSFAGEWQVDETLTRLIQSKAVAAMIVVGIDNAGVDRASEYTPVEEPRHKQIVPRAGDFGKMLTSELIPMIDRTFRTDAATRYVGGSSLGGLVSLELARTHPGYFKGVIAMSPSAWWADGWIVNTIATDPGPFRDVRVWLDFGTMGEPDTKEQGYVINLVRRLAMAFNAAGVKTQYMEVPGGKHNEAAWASRFDKAVLFVTAKD